MDTLFVSFDKIEDPRMDRTKKFSIGEIMFLILCAVLCGVESWRGVEDFGNDRLTWLQSFLPYEHGIPSHQTIGRVMSLLKPATITKAFISFMTTLLPDSDLEIISLDGKTLRRSFDKAKGQKAIHILNAWAVDSGMSLGQMKVDSKTNEITAVPDLLDMIDIKSATIVTDALNTQKTIAAKIVSKGADYALPVKGNHKILQKEIQNAFDTHALNTADPEVYLETIEKGHGRIETRKYSIISADILSQKSEWKGLEFIGKAVNETFRDGKDTCETRYYLLTFSGAKRFAKVVRGHWGIENKLHWVLDVTFREDDCRVRKDHAPENFSTIRKLALNLLRAEKSTKLSIPRKQARASRVPDYLNKILNVKEI